MSKSTRVGLSEYTARRLAELRARRAEADDNGGFSASSNALSVSQEAGSLSNGVCVRDDTNHRNSVAEIYVSSTERNSTAHQIPDSTARLRSEYLNGTPTSAVASAKPLIGGSQTSVSSESTVSEKSSNSSNFSSHFTKISLEPRSSLLDSESDNLSSANCAVVKPTLNSVLSDSSEDRVVESLNERSAVSQRTVANAVLRSSDSFRNSLDVTSRTVSSSSHNIPESAVTSTTNSQRLTSSGSFKGIADSNTDIRPGVNDSLAGRGSPSGITSSNQQFSNMAVSPKSAAPAVCAKPTAAAISMALSASAHQATEADCIGFASLPDQLHRKAAKKGFDFTVMVVGESGLGKSTLLSNLFCKFDLYNDRQQPDLSVVNKTVKLVKRHLEIEDRGIRLRLTVVDTPGYGDFIDSSQCWQLIERYMDEQFEQYYNDETGLNRHNIKDNRVHCCLYFISPYGRGLKPIDVECMKRLHNKVNIVPVIAKADTLTIAETKQLKAAVLNDIKKNGIRTYEMPPCDDEDDEDYKAKDQEMRDSWPFAVIGANCVVDVGGRKVRGRAYPWGFVEAENAIHSDFIKLQQFLISTQLQDLKEVTCDVHYENFRVNRIRQEQNTGGKSQVVETHNSGDTESLLRLKEEEIRKMQQMMMQMQAQLSSTARGQHQ